MSQEMSSVNPADYLRRFSSHLMLTPQDMRVCSHSSATISIQRNITADRTPSTLK